MERERVASAWRRSFAALALAALLAGAAGARADEFDPRRAGNPVRIVAYILHPIGFAFEWLVMRPAHWVVSHEPFSAIFGHETGDLYDGDEPADEPPH
ncbi:MAG TPA: hypothetical protein VMW35_15830 [Myxococcota bacterium]|jgi:hypothetical protein|nr:hypothetical protein [Myxococcota bacterium]